jgi:hypothetical protein
MWKFGYDRSYSHNEPSWTTVATSLTASALIATTYCVYQLVNEYGWEGTYYYVWDGDPHPPHLRDRMISLENIDNKLDKKEKVVSTLEEGLERASLDSVDGSDLAHIQKLWQKNVTKDLRQTLNLLSYDLDELAAKVDQVIAGDVAEIKTKKKDLSTRAVQLMERADALIRVYKSE